MKCLHFVQMPSIKVVHLLRLKAASDADILCSVLRASGGERVNSSKLEFAGCLLRENGGRSEAVAAEEW